jgi:hypothetical protein
MVCRVAGVSPAVESGILPGGHIRSLNRLNCIGRSTGRQDAALYGSGTPAATLPGRQISLTCHFAQHHRFCPIAAGKLDNGFVDTGLSGGVDHGDYLNFFFR